jgi:pimeloyl-ACP methyl ester carboxylesterase
VLPRPQVAAALTSRSAPAQVRAQLVARALFSEAFRREHPDEVLSHLRNLSRHRTSARGLLSHTWASACHDTRARLSRIVAPTLVLHGDADELTPVGNAHQLAALIPDATLELVPGAGHGYLLEQPERAHRLFTSWLAARSPVPPGERASGLEARVEPLTRALGLQTGALRAARSLVAPVRAPTAPRGSARAPGRRAG